MNFKTGAIIAGVALAVIVGAFFAGMYTQHQKDIAQWALISDSIKWVPVQQVPVVILPPVTHGTFKPLPLTDEEKKALRRQVNDLVEKARRDQAEQALQDSAIEEAFYQVVQPSTKEIALTDTTDKDTVNFGKIFVQFQPVNVLNHEDPWSYKTQFQYQPKIGITEGKTVIDRLPFWQEALGLAGVGGMVYGFAEKKTAPLLIGGGLIVLRFSL